MTRKKLAVRAMAGVVFSVVAFVPNNLVRLTSVAFAQDQDGLSTMSRGEKQGGIPANQVVWQHVGRVYLNPHTGKAVWAGYVVHLTGITSSLFNGSPSESTAYFTFSTDILTLTPMPNNGDMALNLVSAGTFSIYYNASPNGDWRDPTSFSNGKLIATFMREESLFPPTQNVRISRPL
jgi:hypothetical protein